jgi:hypothetical protein
MNYTDNLVINSSEDSQLSKLSTICARVIGHFIEHAIHQETTHDRNDHHRENAQENDQEEEESVSGSEEPHPPIGLLTELDWKTSVMDEWYDAIPLLYRRYISPNTFTRAPTFSP